MMKASLLLICSIQMLLAAWGLVLVYRAYGRGSHSDQRLTGICAALAALAGSQAALLITLAR
jgi:hypothetical protein